jgi:hypothetical protein
MQLQLRPSAPRFHPLMRPMYRRAGFAGLGADPSINATTIWTPSGGFVQGGGSPAAVYQAPTSVAVPACSQDTRPGGAAFSSACIAQLLAAQQQNMQLANNANFVVDYANCVGQGLSPATCASRTYGLTPAGGYTSDAGAGPGGSQLILDANGNPVSGVPVYTGPSLTPASTPASGGAASLKFTNLTSGNNSQLAVGDRWQIQISNAARNAPVSVKGGQNGAQDTTPMGSTDSSGNWTSNGQITADQIGSWTEAWTVGGQPVGNFAFTVVPAAAPGSTPSASTTPSTGQTTTGSFMDLFSKTTVIGGTSIPDWALVGAALVAGYFLFMRGK